jgi:hypothetical protein
MRRLMSFLAIITGLVFVFCCRGWKINGIYAPYLGYVLIAIGVFALLGVNLFRGGPLE